MSLRPHTCAAAAGATVVAAAADKSSKATGTDTVGSSEAVLLGGLALKRRWQDRTKAAGKDISKPNIVMGTETHVVRVRHDLNPLTGLQIQLKIVAVGNEQTVVFAS